MIVSVIVNNGKQSMRAIFLILSFLVSAGTVFADSGDPEKQDLIYQSWQVDHPVSTGMLSSLAMGFWPGSFGNDVIEKTGGYSMNSGYGKVAYQYVKQAAEPIFLNSRRVAWVVMAVAALFLFFKIISVRRSR